jgi:hypothetical protein
MNIVLGSNNTGALNGTVDWGNALPLQNFNLGASSNTTLTNTYGPGTFTATVSNFNPPAPLGQLITITLQRISEIIPLNTFTSTNYPSLRFVTISASTLNEIPITFPNSIESIRFELVQGVFNFNPVSIGNGLKQIYFIVTSVQNINWDFSNTVLEWFEVLGSLGTSGGGSLSSINVTFPTTIKNILINKNYTSILPLQNMSFNLNLTYTSLTGITITDNRLSAFSEIIPQNVQIINLNNNSTSSSDLRNRISNFTPNFSNATSLTTLDISNNQVIPSIPSSISSCSSLITIDASTNNISTLPTLPNSVRTLDLGANNFSGNFSFPLPTNLRVLDLGQNNVAKRNSITTFSSTLTTTQISAFTINANLLTSWTTQFPNTIRTVDFAGAANNRNRITTLDLSLFPGIVSLDISQQTYLSSGVTLKSFTGFINFNSVSATLKSLDISNNIFTSGPSNLTPLPPGLTALTMNNIFGPGVVATVGGSYPFSNWNIPLLPTCPNIKNIELRYSKLTQTAVDFILCNLSATTVVGGTLYLDNSNGTGDAVNSAPSAIGIGCRNTLTGTPKNWTVLVAQ